MKDYVIQSGGIFQGNQRLGPGSPITLTEAEAKAMDPHGTMLKLKSVVDAEEKGREAKEKALAESAELEAKAKGKEPAKK